MNKSFKLREKLLVAAIILLTLLIFSYDVYGQGIDSESKHALKSSSSYDLKITGKVISLNARDASLRNILKDIGKRMKIDVVTDITEEERVSVTFHNLMLKDAINRLSTNYVYLMDSAELKGNITKIVVLPKGKDKVHRVKSRPVSEKHANKAESKQDSFKFQFDPSQYLNDK